MNLKKMTLNINGADRMFICDPEKDTLASVLRRLGLTGTKVGCGTGVCGACSVILDGKVIRSCTRKIKNVEEYSSVTTIEGIGTVLNPHPLQCIWALYSADSAYRDSSYLRTSCCWITRTRQEKKSATGSRSTEMSADVPVTSRL